MDIETANLFPNPRSSQKESADPKSYRVVSVRLREGEFLSFSRQTAAIGMTNNMALRIAARRISGFLEIDPMTRQELQNISTVIGDISDDIRDLVELNETVPGFDMKTFAVHQAAFSDQFMQLDRLLRTLLNVSRRRVDGCSLIQAAV